MSLNSIQSLNIGQTVTVTWEGYKGAYIYDSPGSHYTHWTVEYLGPSTPAPPVCQAEGEVSDSIKQILACL